MKRTVIVLGLTFLAAGCDKRDVGGATAPASAAAAAPTPSAAAKSGTREKLLGGKWVATDGDTVEFTNDVMIHDFKSTKGSKVRFPYKVVEDTPEHVVIATRMDLGSGQIVPANTQIISVKGGELTMRSKEGGGTSTFKRAK